MFFQFGNRKYTGVCTLLGGLLSALLGAVVVWGWYSHNTELIQILPAFVPMQFNTAIGFLLAGIGVLALLYRASGLALCFGLLVALIGLLTLTEYILAADLGIDQLAMQHYITVATSHSGRMAPNTALCFSLVGFALLVFYQRLKQKGSYVATSILGSLVLGLGVIAATGYMLDIETAYGWGNLTRMALHTSIGFIVLGMAIISFSWHQDISIEMGLPGWLHFPVGFASLTFCISFWQSLHSVANIGIAEYVALAYGSVLSVTLGAAVYLVRKLRLKAKAVDVVQTQMQEVLGNLEKADKVKDEFLAAISHELRTPMHGILGGLQIAKQNRDEPLKPPLDLILSSASDMMRLINDILIYTEIQSGRLHHNLSIHNIFLGSDILRKRYLNLCQAKGLELQWNLDESVPQWLEVDGEKILTALAKLLDNAVEYTDKGQVCFHGYCNMKSQPWQLVFSVTDSGIGIKDSDHENIFRAFQQNEGGFVRRFGGIGIGLTICKELTEFLGGDLTVDSVPAKGSTFTISCPVAAVRGQAPVRSAADMAAHELPILIVEDNVINQKIMTKMLAKLGYDSLLAVHGEEALSILERDPIALILMDLRMPVMDGFSCTELIRQRDDELRSTPIIAVTANLMDADKEHCLQVGMNSYLKKPVDLNVLQMTLKKYIAAPAL